MVDQSGYYLHYFPHTVDKECSGSVVECLPQDRGPQVRASPVDCVVSLSKTHLSLLSTGSIQEDPSSHS